MQPLSLRAIPLSLLLLAGVLRHVAAGAPPLAGLVPFEKVESVDADPDNAYTLTEKHGPWLIMVTTFQGPTAEESAAKLVQELRKEHSLAAYSHHMTFDYSANFNGRGLNRYGQQQKMRYRHGGKAEEVAVLVGDYSAVNDPRLKSALKRIKELHPQALDDARQASTTFASLREEVLPQNASRKKQDPLRLAFVTTNPLLPESYFQPKGVDRVVLEMNDGVKYSLLNCPGRYTVRVATFAGNVVIDPKRIEEIKQGDEMKSRLIKAAERAHEVTVFLRAKGFEAYEYHDRHSSIVTVGSFESPGKVNQDGSIVYSAEVQEKVDRFRAKPRRQRNGMIGPVTPERIETLNIYLDPSPLVIEVPRRSFGSDYARSMTER